MRLFGIFLVCAVGVGLGACAPGSGTGQAAPGPAAQPYDYNLVIEVTNTSPHAVVIRYYLDGGGPHTLGHVPANSNRTLVPPVGRIGHVFAETEDGRRLASRRGAASVQIRRVRVDPAR